MEVHHHAHHSEKKSWKTYFWEFFMLFLAVFCGFLAEYQLEHIVEKDREKVYIQSLMKELVLDSLDAGKWLAKNKSRMNFNDTLLKLYGKDFSKAENSVLLYKYFLKTTSLPQFDPHTATMTQLKSSGSLRLIHNQAITDSILDYDQKTNFLQKINAAYGENYRDVWNAAFPVLHVNLYYDSSYADYDKKILVRNDFPPIKCTEEHLSNFFGILSRQQTYTRQEIGLLQRQISAANNLFHFLKKEYHFE